jgi:hypothetical protein
MSCLLDGMVIVTGCKSCSLFRSGKESEGSSLFGNRNIGSLVR